MKRCLWQWTGAVGLASALLQAMPAAAAEPQGAAGGLAQAQAALDRGDLDGARPGLSAAAAEAIFELALAERGEPRAADLARAGALAPEGHWIRAAAAGVALLDEEKTAEAIVRLREAVAARSSDKRLQKLLGDALRAQKDDAAGRSRPTTLRSPSIRDTRRRCSGSAISIGRPAISPPPTTPTTMPSTIRDGRGRRSWAGPAARLFLGDEEGAFADLPRAVDVSPPGNERYRALMAIVYAHTYLRQLPQGLDRAEQAVAMWQELGRPEMAAAACNAVGRVLLETGSSGPALEWYDRGWAIVEGSTMKAEERPIWQRPPAARRGAGGGAAARGPQGPDTRRRSEGA